MKFLQLTFLKCIRAWKEILLMLFSIAIVVGSLEFILRARKPESTRTLKSQITTLPSGKLYNTYIPNCESILLGHKVTINADGYRGKLVSKAKPKDVVRIVVFGDSHTFGTGADDSNTYPAALESLLNETRTQKFEVLNFGIGGYQLHDSLLHARQKASKYEPDIILITYHGGDLLGHDSIILDRRSKSAETEATKISRKSDGVASVNVRDSPDLNRKDWWGPVKKLERFLYKNSACAYVFLTNFKGVLQQLGVPMKGSIQSSYEEVANNGVAWRLAKEDILSFNHGCGQQDIQLGFVLMPSMAAFDNHPAKDLHALLYNWLTSNDIPTVDLLPYFAGKSAKKLWASDLDHHPNADGYRIAANGVKEFIDNRKLVN